MLAVRNGGWISDGNGETASAQNFQRWTSMSKGADRIALSKPRDVRIERSSPDTVARGEGTQVLNTYTGKAFGGKVPGETLFSKPR